MNLDNERKAFEEYYIANYHDGDIHPHKKLLEWCEDSESYINSTIDNLWDMWLASANREGYKLVPIEPTDIEIESIKEKHWGMRGCQLCKSDYIDLYKAMIEAQEQRHD